jgi:lysophospholipase L1-like esterase
MKFCAPKSATAPSPKTLAVIKKKHKTQTMKKTLWTTNSITLILLIFLILHYDIPQKVYRQLFQKKEIQTEQSDHQTIINCTYPLEYYDFHYKRESDSPKIIMIGNSIIRHGKWTELLERKDVINRGINGDNLPCICKRLEYLKGKNAKIWFIEGGINDLPGKEPNELFNYYKEIVEFVISENAIPVINLVFYLSPKAGEKFPSRADYKGINKSILELNDLLIEYSKQNKIDYIDLNRLISEDNVLKPEFTSDGVHLTIEAYKLWSIEINRLLSKYKI